MACSTSLFRTTVVRVGEFAEGDNRGAHWRVIRHDDFSDLPGTVVLADEETGEVIMREGWDRATDAQGKACNDTEGNPLWVPRIRKYAFPAAPPRSIRIERR